MKKLLFILFFPLLVFSQENQQRVALVIGNSAYPSDPLDNAVNDARLIDSTLKLVGFDVMLFENLQTNEDFYNAIWDFSKKLDTSDVGFIYYAGHGIEIGTDNYLVPASVDFKKHKNLEKQEAYIKRESYDIKEMMSHLYYEQEGKLNIVVLDACRVPVQVRGSTKKPPINKSSITVNSGTLLAFATRSGEPAEDGEGNNSTYCESFCEQILVPNQTLGEIFGNVREEVEKSTSNNQSPIERSAISGYSARNFFFLQEHDFSKLDIDELEEKAEENKKNGNIEEALNKYTILEIYFKGNMQNIDKKKLRKVYMDMGDIYIKMQDTEPNKYYEEKKANNEWDEDAYNEYSRIHQEYLISASNAFLNAKLLFDSVDFDNQDNKEDYSEVFYKYLREQSYIDFAENKLDYKSFISLINELNAFNKENFGIYNYRTACSYYLKGIFCNSKEPLVAYNSLVQSSNIFSKIEYDADKILGYSISFNPVYPYKWTIKSFNDMLSGAFDEDNFIDEKKAKEVVKSLQANINKNVDSLYDTHIKIIEDGISVSKSNNNEDILGMFEVAKKFTHTFPIVFNASGDMNDINMYKKCSYTTIEYRNASLAFVESHRDSIEVLYQNVITYKNLSGVIDINNIEDLQELKKIIHKSNNDAFELSLSYKDVSYMLAIFNQYSDLYYYSNNDSLYSYSFLKDKINTIDSLFSDIVQVYRKEDNAYALKQYIDDMDSFVKENKLQEEEINKYKRHKDIYSILFPDEE